MSDKSHGRSASGIKPGKRTLQFLACLLIAVLIWLFSSLSSEFTEELTVKLNYSLPNHKVASDELVQEAQMLVQTKGWQLFREELKDRELNIDLTEASDLSLIITNEQKQLFSKSLPPGFELLKVTPDTIRLHIENKSIRRVPVIISKHLSFHNGYSELDSIEVSPDTITVTGPKSKIDSIWNWETELITAKHIKSDLEGTVALKEPIDKNVKLSAVAVRYFIAVGKTDTIQNDSAFINLQKE